MTAAAYAGHWALRMTPEQALEAFSERWPATLAAPSRSLLYCEADMAAHVTTPALARPVLEDLQRRAVQGAAPSILVLDTLQSIGGRSPEIAANLDYLRKVFGRVFVVDLGDGPGPTELDGAACRLLLRACASTANTAESGPDVASMRRGRRAAPSDGRSGSIPRLGRR